MNTIIDDCRYMSQALAAADQAYLIDEVPALGDRDSH